jgi:hypothetical protein
MKLKIFATLITMVSINVFAGDTNVVFREPFTLKLPIDNESYYEQEYPKIPYVIENNIFIFPKEKFRVGITVVDGKVTQAKYDPDGKSDQYFEFEFKPRISDSDGEVSMMLTTKNQTKHDLIFDALMVVPDKQSPLKTSILPIASGLSSYESWPHPILQLMLTNIRVVEKKK